MRRGGAQHAARGTRGLGRADRRRARRRPTAVIRRLVRTTRGAPPSVPERGRSAAVAPAVDPPVEAALRARRPERCRTDANGRIWSAGEGDRRARRRTALAVVPPLVVLLLLAGGSPPCVGEGSLHRRANAGAFDLAVEPVQHRREQETADRAAAMIGVRAGKATRKMGAVPTAKMSPPIPSAGIRSIRIPAWGYFIFVHIDSLRGASE